MAIIIFYSSAVHCRSATDAICQNRKQSKEKGVVVVLCVVLCVCVCVFFFQLFPLHHDDACSEFSLAGDG